VVGPLTKRDEKEPSIYPGNSTLVYDPALQAVILLLVVLGWGQNLGPGQTRRR
jgi:hypothetical protein